MKKNRIPFFTEEETKQLEYLAILSDSLSYSFQSQAKVSISAF